MSKQGAEATVFYSCVVSCTGVAGRGNTKLLQVPDRRCIVAPPPELATTSKTFAVTTTTKGEKEGLLYFSGQALEET